MLLLGRKLIRNKNHRNTQKETEIAVIIKSFFRFCLKLFCKFRILVIQHTNRNNCDTS